MTTVEPRISTKPAGLCPKDEPRIERPELLRPALREREDGWAVRAPRQPVPRIPRDLYLQQPERPADARKTHEGWATRDGVRFDPKRTQVALDQVGQLNDALKGMRDARDQFRMLNPDAPVPSDGQYTIDELLHHPDMPAAEVCVRVVNIIVIECPECVPAIAHCHGCAPPPMCGGGGGEMGQGQPGGGQAQQPGQDPLKGICGFLGPVLSFLGPLLGNPMTAMVLGPLLLATPLAPIVPFLPVILPIAGMAVGGAGSMATSYANGGQPGQPGAAPSGDVFGQLLTAVPAMMGTGQQTAPVSAPIPAA